MKHPFPLSTRSSTRALVLALLIAPASAQEVVLPGGARTVHDLARTLAGRGASVISELCAATLSGDAERIARLAAGGADFEIPSPEVEDAVLEAGRRALGALPADDVAAAVLREAKDRTDFLDRLAALPILERLHSSVALDAMLDLLDEVDPIHFRARAARETVTRTTQAILQEDPRAWRLLQERIRELEEELRATLLDAALDLDLAQTVAFADAMLRADRERALDVLERFTPRAETYRWRLESDYAAELEPWLRDPDWKNRRRAAQILAAFPSRAAADALVVALDDEHPLVRRSARATLESITGVSTPTDTPAWAAQLEEQEHWWREEAATALKDLSSAAPERTAPALRTLAHSGIYRHEAAAEIASLLGRHSGETVELLATALIELGSTQAVPALIDALFSPLRETRMAAGRALRALTGQDLPPDAAAWRAYAFG